MVESSREKLPTAVMSWTLWALASVLVGSGYALLVPGPMLIVLPLLLLLQDERLRSTDAMVRLPTWRLRLRLQLFSSVLLAATLLLRPALPWLACQLRSALLWGPPLLSVLATLALAFSSAASARPRDAEHVAIEEPILAWSAFVLLLLPWQVHGVAAVPRFLVLVGGFALRSVLVAGTQRAACSPGLAPWLAPVGAMLWLLTAACVALRVRLVPVAVYGFGAAMLLSAAAFTVSSRLPGLAFGRASLALAVATCLAVLSSGLVERACG